MNGLDEKTDSGSVQRAVLVGIVAAAVLSMTSLVPVAGEVFLLVGVGLGWWLVPGFWRSVLIGAMGGIVSGILVLGVGLRVAMRVVAIMDPVRSPEFTLAGTMFILIGIGATFGGIVGILANLTRRGMRLNSVVTTAILPAAVAMSLLFVDDEIRGELFELGAGAWVRTTVPRQSLVSVELPGPSAGLRWPWQALRREMRFPRVRLLCLWLSPDRISAGRVLFRDPTGPIDDVPLPLHFRSRPTVLSAPGPRKAVPLLLHHGLPVRGSIPGSPASEPDGECLQRRRSAQLLSRGHRGPQGCDQP